MKKIVKCKIEHYPRSPLDLMPKVHVTFEDGSEKDLFSFYPDEITFSEGELIGLTEQEAYDLRNKKDISYLQSP